MKKTRWIHFSLIFCLIHFSAQAQQNARAREKVMQLLKENSPDSYYLLKTYYALPREFRSPDFKINFGQPSKMTKYLKGDSRQDIIQSLNTLVHEISHSYSFMAAYPILAEKKPGKDFFTNSYSALYINSGQTLVIRHTETFPTKKIKSTIPREMRTFRYRTYVASLLPNLGTQQEGIYGLLDEWNAYYQGTRTAFDFYDYYQQESKKNALIWFSYFDEINGTYFAYLEFKYFILKYLLYARQHYPEIYENIIRNDSFLQAYCAVDTNFKELINKYQQKKSLILEDLKTNGYDAYETDQFLFIDGAGQGNFAETYTKLQKELQNPQYQQLEQHIYSSR